MNGDADEEYFAVLKGFGVALFFNSTLPVEGRVDYWEPFNVLSSSDSKESPGEKEGVGEA